MPEPEKVDTSSQPCATGMQQQSYKSLLNQQVQKLKKQPPLYQTQNEGSEHQPKFRTTVWVDGVSYTSPNTFQQRKQAEADTSKITLFAILQKLKTEALQHILEDKVFSKSILVEYSVRMNLQKPTYHTIKLESPLPIFRSSLIFNDLSYTGDDCRTKKEAEQSAARAVILKSLDSETGNILSEIIKAKFNYPVTKDTQIAQNDTNVGNVLVLNQPKGDEVMKLPFTEPVNTTTTPAMNPPVNITQTHVPQIPTQPPTHTIPMPTVFAQTPLTQFTGTNNAASTHIPQTSIQTTQQPTQTPSVGTNTAHTYSAPSVGHFSSIPATHHSNVVQQATSVPAMNMHPQISTQAYAMPTVMTQAPTQAPILTVSMPTVVSGTNNACTSLPPSTGHFASIPANDSSSNVVQSIKSEASSVTLQTSPPATGKKRNRKSKKNSGQKRTRDENQLAMSAMFHGQVPTFSAQ